MRNKNRLAESSDQEILKHIFGGEYMNQILAEGGSTLVVLGIEGVRNPDSISENTRNWGYIITEIAVSDTLETTIDGYVG